MVIEAGLNLDDFLLQDLDAIGFRVVHKLLGQIKAGDVFKSWIVFHTIRIGNLSAGQAFFDQHRLERRPHGIDACSEPRRAAPNDYQIVD